MFSVKKCSIGEERGLYETMLKAVLSEKLLMKIHQSDTAGAEVRTETTLYFTTYTLRVPS